MKKLFLILCIILIIFNQAIAAEYADIMPLPKNYKQLPLRERIAAIAESQAEYTQAYNGATAFHQDLFGKLKRQDYKYDCPWNTVYIAWVFKKCGIYTDTFANYSALSKDTLEKRFITAGNSKGELAYAFFDYNYLRYAKPGDIVFLDKYRRNSSDYEDMSHKRTNSQVSIVIRNNQGALTLISPYFHLKVWEGELNTEYNLHSPYNISGFGVIDAKPTKETIDTIKTPLIAYELNSGRQIYIYYIYKDGTCLTSNGERHTSDFFPSLDKSPEKKMSAKMRSTLYKTITGNESFGKLPDMTEFYVTAEEEKRVQIVFQWKLNDGKAEFPIYTTAWINKN